MKRYIIFLILSLLFALPATSQVVIKKTLHQFGDIFSYSNRVVDFHVENRGTKPIKVSKVDGPEVLSYLVSNSTIKPGETVLFRVKYNPQEIGLFHEKIDLYLSAYSKPITFTVEGKSHHLPVTESLAAPNFQTIEANLKIPFEIDVKIVDKEKGDPIPNAKVKLYTKGLELKTMTGNSTGRLRFNTFLGYYYFIVSAEGYATKKFDEYVNHHNPDVLVRMSGEVEEEEEDEELLAEKPLSIDDYNPKDKPVILFEDDLGSGEELASNEKVEENKPSSEEVKENGVEENVVAEGVIWEEPKDDNEEQPVDLPEAEVVKATKVVDVPKPIKVDTLYYAFEPIKITRDRLDDAAVVVETKVEKVNYASDDFMLPSEMPDIDEPKRSDVRRDLNELRAELEEEEAEALAILEKQREQEAREEALRKAQDDPGQAPTGSRRAF